MMSQVIEKEVVVFLMAAGHGAILALFYDFFRALRQAIPHSMRMISAEDFLFWIAAGFLTFCLLFLETDGEIRGYVAAGIGLGTALYLQLFSVYVRIVLTAVLGFVRDLICLIYRLLFFPVRKLSGFLAVIRRNVMWTAVVYCQKKRKDSHNSERGENSSKNIDETVRKTKKRIEFPVKRVYNKKKRAENRRKKTGVHMHRQYERGSLDDSGRRKEARKQKQPQRNAGHRRCGSLFAGGGAGPEPEADGKK